MNYFTERQSSNYGEREVKLSGEGKCSRIVTFDCPYCETTNSDTVLSDVVEIQNFVCFACGSYFSVHCVMDKVQGGANDR